MLRYATEKDAKSSLASSPRGDTTAESESFSFLLSSYISASLVMLEGWSWVCSLLRWECLAFQPKRTDSSTNTGD